MLKKKFTSDMYKNKITGIFYGKIFDFRLQPPFKILLRQNKSPINLL